MFRVRQMDCASAHQAQFAICCDDIRNWAVGATVAQDCFESLQNPGIIHLLFPTNETKGGRERTAGGGDPNKLDERNVV